jgi:tape measure domain-containing protein
LANETVTLTAELKDQMSAPLQTVKKSIDGFTKTVEDGARKQSAAVDKSTAQIDGSVTKQNRLFSGMTGPIGKATDGAARLFSGMKSRISESLDGLAANAEKSGKKAAEGFSGKLAGAVTGFMGGAMRTAGVGGGLTLGAAFGTALFKGFGRLQAIEEAKAKLTGLGHSGEAVTQIMNDAMASVKGTSFGLGEAATVSASMVASGIKPGKDLENVLRLVGDSATIAGTDLSSMGAVFGKVAASGKVQGDILAQLADMGIPIVQFLSKELGVSAEETYNLASAGKINFDTFAKAMQAGLGGAALKSGETLKGAFKNTMASVGRIGANLLSGVYPKIQQFFAGAITWMKPLEEGAKVAGAAIGKFLDKALEGAKGLYDLLVKGDFTSALRNAFGWEEDSKLVDFLLNLRDGFITAKDVAEKFAAGLALSREDAAKLGGQIDPLVGHAYNLKVNLENTAKALWDNREPIGIVAGLIFTLLIPGLVKAGTEALTSAAKQKLAWAMTQTASTRAVIMNSIAAWTVVGSWILMGAQATIQAVKIAAAWLIAMGPVGWIIGIIALLVGAFVWAYENVGWFRDGVDAAMRFVGDVVRNVADWIVGAWNNVVDWWNSTLMPALAAVGQFFADTFTNIGNWARDFVGFFVDGWGMLVDFWNNTLIPAFQAVADFFAPVLDWIARLAWNFATIVVALFLKLVDFWNGVLLPGLQAVGDFFMTIFRWVYETIIKPYIDLWVGAFRAVVDWWNLTFLPALQAVGDFIGSVMNWIYNTLIKPVIDFIVAAFRSIVDFWNLTLIPGLQAVGDFIGSVMNWIYTTLIQPVIDLIVGAFRGLTDWWNSTLMPAAQAVGDWFSVTIGGAINGVKSFIDDLIKNFQTFMTFVGDKLKPVIDGIKGAFDAVAKAIGDVLGKIGEFANNPLGGIQDWLGIKKDGNGQGVMPQNSGGGVYAGDGVRFAGGGVLGGYAPGHDSILARLSPGESVLVPELTKAIGPANIMAANAAASGGRPAGSGPSLTSGYSAASASRGGGVTISAPVTIQVAAGADGSVDTAALRAAVEEAFEDILAEHNRRGY